MGLSVIGAGFGRTGTMSLKLALEQLGFGPCHHMEEIFDNPPQLPLWQAAVAGDPVDWDQVYKGYNATADWPGAYFSPALAEFYPDAKIILTTRPVDSWWGSYSNTIMKYLLDLPGDLPDHIEEIVKMVVFMLGEKTFKSALNDEHAIKLAYQNHVERMSTSYADGRVLCFDVKDGWEPLCNFLETPVPDGDFPRTNNRVEFWDNFSPDR
ncbi:MAG: sulfotransferase family protein [Rhodospirillales bacterium]|nr:sulfotransferase family protein [Rhodospirillales bacterium]